MSTAPQNRRYFEDLVAGEVFTLGRTTISREMIFDYAHEFDPLPFHLDETAAKASLLGGLASSGWQTAALSQRMLVDSLFSRIASLGEIGVSDLKWRKPVMVGDTISGTATIVDLRRSNSHPERGILTLALDIRNQRDEPVMTLRLTSLVSAGSAPTGATIN